MLNRVSLQLKSLADDNETFHHASSAIQGQKPTKDDVSHAEFWYLSCLDVFAQATKDSYQSAEKMRKAGVELNEETRKVVNSMNKGKQTRRPLHLKGKCLPHFVLLHSDQSFRNMCSLQTRAYGSGFPKGIQGTTIRAQTGSRTAPASGVLQGKAHCASKCSIGN